MIRPLRIVVPFRPFPPESDLHKEVADFDWLEALRMVVHSARLSCQCEVVAITDVDTALPVPALKYDTTQRRLMLWTLEICAAYLESADCDRDTVMLDVDQLIFGDLATVFDRKADFGVLVRPDAKYSTANGGLPLLNGVQYWRGKARKPLAAMFRRALAYAQQLPDARIVWGADTDAVLAQIEPIELGVHPRGELRVQMVDSIGVLEAFSSQHVDRLHEGLPPWPRVPVLDFRYTRKKYMASAYRATILEGAVA